MEPLSRPEVIKLPLPPGLKASTVVGRGGHNVRWIHFHSGGAHITVNDTGITIRAKETHVRERARILVQRQLDAAKRLGAHLCLLSRAMSFCLLHSGYIGHTSAYIDI